MKTSDRSQRRRSPGGNQYLRGTVGQMLVAYGLAVLLLLVFGLGGYSLSYGQSAAPENAAIRALHERVLYPVVRIQAGPAQGSGTVVYSASRVADTICRSFVLTNHHVIADAISIKEAWDSVLQKNVKKEYRTLVKIEIFRYTRLSTPSGRTAWDADIVAYSEDEDLALVELRSEDCYPYLARLLPRDRIHDLRLFMPTWAVGASLGHVPIPTEGRITGLAETIESKRYEMSTAQIIFGNSGGAMYLQDGLYFIGIPSRVVGTWTQVITHMGLYIPIERIYAWLEKEHLRFIYDPTMSIEAEMTWREAQGKKGKDAAKEP